jgi:hypothetical protein
MNKESNCIHANIGVINVPFCQNLAAKWMRVRDDRAKRPLCFKGTKGAVILKIELKAIHDTE